MENILSFLKQLDLSEIEAKLYLNLLKNGPTSVRDLALTIEIKRTTAYFYIDQLVDKGLVMKQVRGSKKLVAANPPETLEHLVEKKVTSANIVEQSFPAILKTLTENLPQHSASVDAEIKYYKGKNGVRKIYEDALRSKEIRAYVNLSELEEVFPENFKLFDIALKENHDFKMYEIVEDSPLSRERIERSKQNGQFLYKIMPKGMELTPQDILIYEGKVSIISLKGDIHGIVLRNTDFYNNFRTLFDLNWKILSDKSTT
jgi:sugar-specific transcriptional regulator TrmB